MNASEGGDSEAALVAVQQAIEELDALTREGIDSGDSGRLRARADRWKRATVELLREHASPEDVNQFARKPIAPTWVGMEDSFALLSSHRAYLLELAREIHDHPDRYRKRRSAANAPLATPRAASTPETGPTAPVSYPERVTLAWLFKHAPVSLVVAGVALVVAAFALGFRLGQDPNAVHALSWIPGMSR